MNNFQLLTPVLYFFVGSISNEHIGLIKNIQSNLISNYKGIQYISDLSELPLAHTAFLKTPFNTVGEIRVNFIIDTSSAASCNINQTIEAAYNFLRLRYTTFAAIDAYCILNESSGDFKLMSDSINSVNTLRGNNMLNIVYLLSNIDSKGVSSDDYKKIFEAVAYMPLVLDCALLKDMQSGWFDERYFKQLSSTGAQCCTIGSLVLKKPDEAIYNEVVINVIKYFNDILCSDKSISQYYSGKLIKELSIDFDINIKTDVEDLYAVLENNDKNINKLIGYTNYEIIQNTFEDRIDVFFDLNFTETGQSAYNTALNNISKNIKLILDDAVKDPLCGIFGLLHTIKLFDKEISILKKEYEDKLHEAQYTLCSWQNANPAVHKKTLGVFTKIYLLPYEVAHTYITLKTNELIQSLNTLLLDEIITIIHSYGDEIEFKANALENQKYVLADTNRILLSDKENVITQDFAKYYASLTYEFINSDYNQFKKLYSGLCSGNIEYNEKSILNYAKNVVESELFSKSIVDEINGRITKDSAIYESGTNGKNYNIFLRSGESGKHREICLFTNGPSSFSAYAKEQGVNPEFDKLNIMYGPDSNQLIFIYMLGVFSIDDLFYRELYCIADK